MSEIDFREAFKKGCICLHLESDSKVGVIKEMIDMLVAAGQITDRAEVLRAVLEREDKMSTGMQYGVAIPHGKTGAVNDLVTVFALKNEGIDFDSIDGTLSKIFIMTISSINRTGPHIKFLSGISKLLNSESVRKQLLNAQSKEEIIEIMTL